MTELDLVGQKYNKLKVIFYSESNENCICLCECGNKITVDLKYLKSNRAKSCGCLSLPEVRKIQLENVHISNIKYEPRIASARRVWKRYKKQGLSFENFYRLSQENCFYCNCLPIYNKYNEASMSKNSLLLNIKDGDFYYNGLDRVDSLKGYTIDNIVPCCIKCNMAKQDRSLEDFYKWVNKIGTYLNKKIGF